MKKGFTLIELLVVISIIGVLSTIVLSSLNKARDKAHDARAKSVIRSVATQAEIYALGNSGHAEYGQYGWRTYSNNNPLQNGYWSSPNSSICTSDRGVEMIDSISYLDYVWCRAGYDSSLSESYFTSGAVLKNGEVFCVDKSGFAGTIPNSTSIYTSNQHSCN